jgi:hypothetical protein
MIRLSILIGDVVVRPQWKWAHWVRLLTHQRLTGVSPWQHDDLERVARADLRLAWGRSAVRFGRWFADMTSHERKTRTRLRSEERTVA